MAERKTSKKKSQYQGANEAYYLVNPAGAIHSVSKEHARVRLAQVGWRLATDEEIAVYLGQRVQRADRPIAPAWTPDPDAQLAEALGEDSE